jgi:hypothetical protein
LRKKCYEVTASIDISKVCARKFLRFELFT